MAPTSDTPPTGKPDTPAPEDELNRPSPEHDEHWKDSSWDLRRGLDIAELNELPAEWRPLKPT